MPPLAAAAASSSSSRCGPFASSRGADRQRVQTPAAASSGHGCGRPLGRAAGLVGSGIAAAFFASLERCACVELRTADDLAEVGAPLMQLDDVGAARDTARKGRRTVARTGKEKGRRGGGFGCCESIN